MFAMASARHKRPAPRKNIITPKSQSSGSVGFLFPRLYRLKVAIIDAIKKPLTAILVSAFVAQSFSDGTTNPRIRVNNSPHVDNTATLMSFTTLR